MCFLCSVAFAQLAWTSPAGIMCSLSAKSDRPSYQTPGQPTEAEVRAVVNGLSASCGPFEVDTKSKTITQHVQLAKVPNQVGVARVFKYNADAASFTLQSAEGTQVWSKVN